MYSQRIYFTLHRARVGPLIVLDDSLDFYYVIDQRRIAYSFEK